MTLLQIFGTIDPPPFLANFGSTDNPTGLVEFISNLIRFAIVMAGLYAFLNLILAGYQFMSSGQDPKGVAMAWSRIYQTILGLTVVAAAMLITAVISLVIFGDALSLLQLTIYGPNP